MAERVVVLSQGSLSHQKKGMCVPISYAEPEDADTKIRCMKGCVSEDLGQQHRPLGIEVGVGVTSGAGQAVTDKGHEGRI